MIVLLQEGRERGRGDGGWGEEGKERGARVGRGEIGEGSEGGKGGWERGSLRERGSVYYCCTTKE